MREPVAEAPDTTEADLVDRDLAAVSARLDRLAQMRAGAEQSPAGDRVRVLARLDREEAALIDEQVRLCRLRVGILGGVTPPAPQDAELEREIGLAEAALSGIGAARLDAESMALGHRRRDFLSAASADASYWEQKRARLCHALCNLGLAESAQAAR